MEIDSEVVAGRQDRVKDSEREGGRSKRKSNNGVRGERERDNRRGERERGREQKTFEYSSQREFPFSRGYYLHGSVFNERISKMYYNKQKIHQRVTPGVVQMHYWTNSKQWL